MSAAFVQMMCCRSCSYWVQAAVAACSMQLIRKLLRKTRVRGGWSTIYLLQRLGPDGALDRHYKVGPALGSRVRGPEHRLCRETSLL